MKGSPVRVRASAWLRSAVSADVGGPSWVRGQRRGQHSRWGAAPYQGAGAALLAAPPQAHARYTRKIERSIVTRACRWLAGRFRRNTSQTVVGAGFQGREMADMVRWPHQG